MDARPGASREGLHSVGGVLWSKERPCSLSGVSSSASIAILSATRCTVPPAPTVTRTILRLPSQTRPTDQLAVEEPLEIRVDDLPLAVTMRTPGHDAELAVGFCFTEAVVDHPDQIEHVEPCHLAQYGNVVVVRLTDEARAARSAAVAHARRELYLSSSCGLCGTQSIDRIARHIAPIDAAWQMEFSHLVALPERMTTVQETFADTGGLHAAAWFNLQGEVQLLYEDVGRHNALDKLIGALLLSGQLPAKRGGVVVSGRASFELVQKAARAGVPLLAAVGAPSSLAVASAERFGMTLIGFLRQDRCNVYCGEQRILFTGSTAMSL